MAIIKNKDCTGCFEMFFGCWENKDNICKRDGDKIEYSNIINKEDNK